MKKVMLLAIFACIGMFTYAQGYEIKDDGQYKVLHIDGKKFTGKRAEIWKLEKDLKPQPISEELAILFIDGHGAVQNQYLLLRFIDNQWEYITAFEGGTVPMVSLQSSGMFTAFQKQSENLIERNYVIHEVALMSYPSQRRWVLVESNTVTVQPIIVNN